MPDYSKSKIYKIVCNITGLIYIGSTTKNLFGKIQDHKYDYKYYLNIKSYSHWLTSFEIIEKNNYDIILVEDFPCERKEQLHARERYWIENTECVNKVIPTRTKKEYWEDNKQKIAQQRKNHYEDNKETINKKHKEYCLKNKEKRKEKRKEYDLKNKEKIKEYYEKNKERINQYQREYRLKKKISSI